MPCSSSGPSAREGTDAQSLQVIALSATASAVFEIPVMLFGRRFIEKLGLRGFFVVGCVMYLAAVVSWIVSDDPMVLVASRVLTGFGFGSFMVSSVVALGVLLPEELQASGQALRTSAVFAVAVVGYFCGGFIYGLLGSATFFAIAACGPVLGAILAWRWLPASNEAATSAIRQRHWGSVGSIVIARSVATKRSRRRCLKAPGLLRFARNDGLEALEAAR